MDELPTGTVTFLFTDLEGSTRLWEEHPEAMRDAVTRHDEILHDAVEVNGGVVFSTMGDGIAAAFPTAPEALAAAVQAQERLGTEPWGDTGPLRARMGIHSAEARLRAPGQYVNRPLNRCARLMAVGHGGQVLVSESTASLTRDALPSDAVLADLGEHRLRDLDEAIRVFQLDHPDLVRGFPPLRSLDVLPGNLPRQLTTFVGRQRELEELSELVRTRPLITLTGVGGVGKTRLALQVAADVVTEFRDGAWLCELAPVSDPGALWETVAAALGVQPFPGRSMDEAVLEYLAPRRLLLALDNCEHVLQAAARLVEAVARRCPQVAVLATSREGLAVPGEQTVAVPSLGLPPVGADVGSLADAAAVQLFVDRAHDAKREFELTEANVGAVAQLCRRLDGIPLAIELAAARVRSLTPDDLVSRLDQRFRLLTRGSRAAIERHQTLRNTIDWSYELLTEDERDALNRMSVFAGGCDLAAAEAVLPGGAIDEADVVDLVTSLVDKSLVLVDDQDGITRYRLLETIRQYAQERLEAGGHTAAVRRHHADHYVERAEAAAPRLRGHGQTRWSTAIARDTDNYRVALDWAVETTSPDHALRLVAAFAVHGTTIGYSAMDWADTAIDVPGAIEHPKLGPVAAWAAWGATLRGDLDRAGLLVQRAEQAEERLGSRDPLVRQARATFAWFSGDLDGARAPTEEWVRLARASGDRYELAHALIMWASVNQLDDLDRAIADVEEALQVARDGGVASALAIGLAWMAGVLGNSGASSERVTALLDEALEIGLEVGDRMTVSQVRFYRGWFAADQDEWPAALRGALDAADDKLSFGDLAMMRAVLGLTAVSFAHLGSLETAAVVLGACGGLETDVSHVAPDNVLSQYAWLDAEIARHVDPEQVATLRARGARMAPAEAVAYSHIEAAKVLSEA